MKRRPPYRFLKCTALLIVAYTAAAAAGEILPAPSTTGRGPVPEKKEEQRPPLSALPSSLVPAALSSALTATVEKAQALEPLFVRPLTTLETGRNDSSPQWSPPGTLLAFERSRGDKKEINIVYADGTPVETVYHQLSAGSKESKFFFPGVYEDVSYNAGISWASGGDRFIFMSNGGEGNYDLYVQELGRNAARLTDHKEKDGQAHWSPASDGIVFVSGRTGNGDLYLMDLQTRALTRLTHGGKAHLYPQWSPDGKKIALMHGSSENHDIVLLADPTKQGPSKRFLTTWAYDDLRPVWSPNGKKIAFYSNYNPANDPKVWSIIAISADGTEPTEGEGLAARVVATDVVPDVEVGPAWMPDSTRIVYVKNDRQEYNPLYIADTERQSTMPIKTDTRMNHDVACSSDGTIAFRAQVNQWDQIFIMRLQQ